MSVRRPIESLFTQQVTTFTDYGLFRALETGQAPTASYISFIENVVRTHLKSPQLLAFLFALAPPQAADNLQHNMLEELGSDQESDIAHPSLLKQLAVGAGLAHRLSALEAQAEADLRQIIATPLLYGTLKEVGLAALYEVTAFEFMLSRVAQRIANALASYCGLSLDTLLWFTHHAAVDQRHAEQGFENLLAYIHAYEFSDADALTILTMTLRENIFSKRYFGMPLPSTATATEVKL